MMTKKCLRISLCLIFLFISFPWSSSNLTEALNLKTSSLYYSAPQVSIGDIFSWEITHNTNNPENIGLVLTLKIVDIQEDNDYWRIYYLKKYPGDDDYYHLPEYLWTFHVLIGKKFTDFNFANAGGKYFCPLPVNDYLEEYCNTFAPSGYTASGNRLIYTVGNNVIEWAFNSETGVLTSYTDKTSGRITYRYGDPLAPNDAISGYHMILTIWVFIVALIGIIYIVLERKQRI